MNHELGIAAVPNTDVSCRVERKATDVHMIAPGHTLFAVGLVGVGVLKFGIRDFAYTWQPVPEWVICRSAAGRPLDS
jgi:hypothetical protein